MFFRRKKTSNVL